MIIGGKTRRAARPAQPQFVVRRAPLANAFMQLITVDGVTTLAWIGDPAAATKFDSKYAAKCRVREIADVPDSRAIVQLGERGAGRL
jgi:hypothetical protein